MLERTVSLLRRLVGMKAGTAAESAAETERRMRERYPSNLEIIYRPAGDGVEIRFTGRVRNISLGGINVVVNRRFEPGELLSVELPGVEGRPMNTVLACVIHVTPQPDGEWALGCNFARELTDEDLAVFGARRQRPDTTDDQRTWQRFNCNVHATCRPVVPQGEAPSWPAKVLNISANGIGLLSSVAVPTGSLLSLDLHGSQGNPPLTVLACVVHSTGRVGEWALGCNFIRELQEDELRALV